jgi:uncharacterized protein
MQEAENTQVVREAYAAFGRADIQGVLNTLHDDILWKPITGAGPHVPTAGERWGKPSVEEFFRILAESTTFDQFEPREFVAQNDKVVALGHYRATTKRGGRFESDWTMVFTLRAGKIARFQEFTDSAAINAAFAGVAARA